jgi:hypothetical protein
LSSLTLTSNNGNDALKGQYRIVHYLQGKGWHPQLKSGDIHFACGELLAVGDTVGELTVIATDDVELLEQPQKSHHKYASYGRNHSPERAEIPALDTQYELLDTLLNDRSYMVVDNIDDFRNELLSGEYQQYLLLSERQSLDHFTAKLLREAVNRGEGLVFAGGKAPTTDSLWEILGIAPFKDKHHHKKGWGHHHGSTKVTMLSADGIQLVETPLATASENYFSLDRELPYITLDNANFAATLLSPKVKQDNNAYGGYQPYSKYRPRLPQDIPSITYTQYGEGKAVFMAYDVLAEATQQGGDTVDNVQANILLSRDLCAKRTNNYDALRHG